MKKILLTTGIFIATLLGAKAQTATPINPSSGEEQKTSQELSNLISACNLTPAQAVKARPVITEAVKSKEANEKQYGSNKNKLKTANAATTKMEVAKLSAIMNADQKAKLAAYEQQEAAKMQSKVRPTK